MHFRPRSGMKEEATSKAVDIRPDMTVLDVVSRYRSTEHVFREYDQEAGICICCEALFESVAGVAGTYGLDLERLITDLAAEAGSGDQA